MPTPFASTETKTCSVIEGKFQVFTYEDWILADQLVRVIHRVDFFEAFGVEEGDELGVEVDVVVGQDVVELGPSDFDRQDADVNLVPWHRFQNLDKKDES